MFIPNIRTPQLHAAFSNQLHGAKSRFIPTHSRRGFVGYTTFYPWYESVKERNTTISIYAVPSLLYREALVSSYLSHDFAYTAFAENVVLSCERLDPAPAEDEEYGDHQELMTAINRTRSRLAAIFS